MGGIVGLAIVAGALLIVVGASQLGGAIVVGAILLAIALPVLACIFQVLTGGLEQVSTLWLVVISSPAVALGYARYRVRRSKLGRLVPPRPVAPKVRIEED